MSRQRPKHGVGGQALRLREAESGRGWMYVALAVLVLLLGCPPKTQISRYPQVPKVAPIPQSTEEALVECRIDVVVRPPPGATPVGMIGIPARVGFDVVLDQDARRQACALGATHGVREESFVDRSGQLQQTMRLYRDAPALVEGLDTQGEVQGSEGAQGGGQAEMKDPSVDGGPRPNINGARKVDP